MKFKDLYNELYANGYHSDTGVNHTHRLYSYIDRYVDRHAKILDIGCSHGTAMLDLRKKGYDTYGIDISSTAIEYCEMRGLDNVRVNSSVDIHWPDNYFDCIISSDTLEHLDPTEVEPTCLEMKRLLKPGGSAILAVSTKPERNRKYDSVAEAHGVKNLHTSIYSVRAWERKFKKYFAKTRVLGGARMRLPHNRLGTYILRNK